MGAADRIADTLLRIGQIQGDSLNRSGDIRARALELAAEANARGVTGSADALARATAANGQIWGQTLSQLGALPGQVMQVSQQQKAQQLENQSRQIANDRAMQIQQGEKAFQTLLPQIPRTDDGLFDVAAATPFFAKAGMTSEQTADTIRTLDALNSAQMGVNKVRSEHAADLANAALESAKKSGEPLSVMGATLWLNGAAEAGVARPAEVDQIKKALLGGADPTQVFTAIRNQGEKYRPKPITNETEAAMAAAGGDPTAQAAMKVLKPTPQPTEASIAMQAAGNDPTKAMGILKPPPPAPKPPATGTFEDYVTRTYGASPTPEQIIQARKDYGQAGQRPPAAPVNANDPKDIADAIIRGEQPPTLTGLYRNAGPVRAELARQGYDLATAQTDWTATQKHIATLNGAQQTRLNQAIGQLPELLDSVESLAKQWKGGKFPILNKANLALAKNGAYGSGAASIATQLEQQIADVTGDLGAVYMGGNSPTDHALDLARTALSSNWDEKVLLDMVNRARKNVAIRQNSIKSTGVQGVSGDNPYAPAATTIAPPTGRYNPATGKVE
jgi:hypothetical protein